VKTDTIRETFLSFFERRGHKRLPSDSLVPTNDPTLLFTGAGMNQFKDEFQGKGRVRQGLRRACTSQKCLRASDLEKVGQTPSHHTFFEMLGNFSFGDYFKREAMAWAWELVVEGFHIPSERLVVTCYEGDDEASAIWREIGIPTDRIYRFGEHDNYWPADAPSTAPPGTLCGPCAEIFYDYGPRSGCRRPSCDPSCDCPRFVEIWNLVFQQFLKGEDGRLEPLPSKNIDTGAGLERLAAVLQGVSSDYETDIFAPIVSQVVELTGARPDEPASRERIWRISDHLRGAVFCICDGVLPGNKGRGYVLRRILRRAIRDAHDLGTDRPFLYRIVPTVVEVMGTAYPELRERRENVARIIEAEESAFLATVSRGSAILAERLAELRSRGVKALPGELAAELWDTYGFPFEMTRQLCAEHGIEADRQAFEKALEDRQAASKSKETFGQVFDTSALAQVKAIAPPTRFVGYQADAAEADVVAIVAKDQLVEEAGEGADVVVVLDATPFYGEAGGQVGDTGTLEGEGLRVEVTNTTRADDYFYHHGRVTRGTVRKGQRVRARVDAQRRADIRRNHTATHLLHWALRKAIGQHVEQAGSLVAPDRLRFDFTHFAPLSPQEVQRVEELVNQRIVENAPVVAAETTLDEARRQGAIALFGEKYGESVRMIAVGDFSRELCGGTHAHATGELGLFKITAEQGIAAGVRRIEAVTGRAAYRLVADQEALLDRLAETLRTPRARLVERARELLEETKRLARELEKAKRRSFAAAGASGPFEEKATVGHTVVVVGTIPDASPDDLRLACDQLRQRHGSAAVVVGTADNASAKLVCALTADLVEKGLDAAVIVKAAAKNIGGGGGGRPDMAQAGGRNPQGLQAALDHAATAIAQILSNRQD